MPLRKPMMALGSLSSRTTNVSCASEEFACRWSAILSVTAKPERCNLCYVDGDVATIIFDFDGTLTATPGEHATHKSKVTELRERASMLEPHLQRLRNEGIVLGIMSKSTEATVTGALEEAGLRSLFNGPTVFKALGFEGKAGIIQEMCSDGAFAPLAEDDLHRILLVDDDVYELERARDRSVQTYAAPENGGLQDADFYAIFVGLGLEEAPEEVMATAASMRSVKEAAVFPESQRIIRVWSAGLTGVSLGLDLSETQHVNTDTGIGPLFSNLYEVQAVIGRGGFSVIASGRHLSTGRDAALKAVRKEDAGVKYYDNFVTRDICNFILRMTAEAPHRNIIHFFDFLEGDDFLFGIMEALTGPDLSVFLQEHSPITTSLSQHLAGEVLAGLKHFHCVLGSGLIHRDVKLENLQFRSPSEDAPLVLVDVGLACLATPLEEKRQVVGTLLYTAPEVFTSLYSTQVDIWSLGVVCYIMLTGKPPWIQDRRTFKDRKVIDDGHVQRALATPDVKRLPEPAADFLALALHLDPDQRLTAATGLEHPWLKMAEPTVPPSPSRKTLEASPSNYEITRNASRRSNHQCWADAASLAVEGEA